MAKVKLNLRNLSALELIALGRQIHDALAGNPDFPNPQPPLATLNAELDGLETANADVQKAKQDIATKINIRDTKEDSVRGLLRQSAAFVESVAGDNQKIILGAGMGVRSPASPSQPPSVPGNLTGSQSDHDGELDLHWDSAGRAVTGYEVQRSLDPPTATSWIHETIS